MVWKKIFNAHLKMWKYRDTAAKAARECGYKLMSWNGDIYYVGTDGKVYETNLTVEDLDGESE